MNVFLNSRKDLSQILMIINNQASLEEAISQLKKDFEESKYLELDIKRKGKTRSGQQNRALHKYFQLLADALNDAGYDMRNTLKCDVEMPWSPDMIKEWIWRPVQKAMFDIDSTAKMKRADYTKVWEVLNRHTSSRFGIAIQWPSED